MSLIPLTKQSLSRLPKAHDFALVHITRSGQWLIVESGSYFHLTCRASHIVFMEGVTEIMPIEKLRNKLKATRNKNGKDRV